MLHDTHRMAAASGVIAAGTGLAVSELMAGLSSQVPSLVAAVGDLFVDGAPGGIASWLIEQVGTADKPLLIAGVIGVTLLVGAKLGTASLTRWWIGPVGIGVWTLIGAWAGARDPLTAGGGGVGAALVSGIAALGVFGVLMHFAAATAGELWPPLPTIDEEPQPHDRRDFLRLAGVAAVGAGFVALVGRSLSGRFDVSAARAEVALPRAGNSITPAEQGLDVDGVSAFITSNADFYRIDTALVVPQIAPDDFNLEVNGLVDRPLDLSYDDLLAMPQVEATATIACVSNEIGGDLVGNAVWQGVLLTDLLADVGLQADADQIMGRSVDGFSAGFPTEIGLDGRPAMVAVGMNGEPLPIVHGFPARLIVPGIYGYVSATKWLRQIELTTLDADGYWVPRGWSKEGPVKTQSRIDTPGGDVAAGTVPVAGVAWAPIRGVARVEVQVDAEPWQEAELGPGTTDLTWRQWVYRWDAQPGAHQVQVRATDGDGETQTSDSAPPRPDGATGWHRRTITVT